MHTISAPQFLFLRSRPDRLPVGTRFLPEGRPRGGTPGRSIRLRKSFHEGSPRPLMCNSRRM